MLGKFKMNSLVTRSSDTVMSSVKRFVSADYICSHCLRRHFGIPREGRVPTASAKKYEIRAKWINKKIMARMKKNIQPYSCETRCFEPVSMLPVNVNKSVDKLSTKQHAPNYGSIQNKPLLLGKLADALRVDSRNISTDTRVSLRNDICQRKRKEKTNDVTYSLGDTSAPEFESISEMDLLDHLSSTVHFSSSHKDGIIFNQIAELRDNINHSSKNAMSVITQKSHKNVFACHEEDPFALLNEEVNTADQQTSIQTSTPENKSETNNRHKYKERFVQSKDHMKQQLSAFVDVCISNNMTELALSKLKIFRKYPRPDIPVANIDIYNQFLYAYSRQNNLQKLNEIISLIKESNLSLNCNSYAAVLLCMSSGRRNITSQIVKEMQEKNILVNDLFTKTELTGEEQEKVLKQIQLILPSFKPTPEHVEQDSNCLLLKNLYHQNEGFMSPIGQDLQLNFKKLIHEQIEVEEQMFIEIKCINKKPLDNRRTYVYRLRLERLLKYWEALLKPAFDKELKLHSIETNKRHVYYFSLYPYLKCLPAEDFVEILIQEIKLRINGSDAYSPSRNQLCIALGERALQRYEINLKKKEGYIDKMETLMTKYCHDLSNSNGKNTNPRKIWTNILKESTDGTLDKNKRHWPIEVKQAVGRFLYDLMIRYLKVDNNILRLPDDGKRNFVPAFYRVIRNRSGAVREELKMHPNLTKLHKEAALDTIPFESKELPMVCPPVPWRDVHSGGSLILKSDLVRLPPHAQAQNQILKNEPVQKMYPVLDSLNQASAVPWSINRPVLDVIIEVFQNGGSESLDVPEPPSSCPMPETHPGMTKTERNAIYYQRRDAAKKRAEMYSLWCTTLYNLSIADHLRNKVVWLPTNMDFRGRIYPIAPVLNHLGCDLSRSLFLFAKGRPLGPSGLNWVKIHTVNLAGKHKKESNTVRLQYANKILPEILDSAERPLTGSKWWTEAEDPWQTLAACMEIRNALDCSKPEKYVSHLPIHQDGSCNGLQHYAALGRDMVGAESVNLVPASIPQDVYNSVVDIVEKERKQDAENGVEIAQILEGFIRRKVIKQTVMTTVYGVTRFGGRLQIARQLEDLPDFPRKHVWEASFYLVQKTFSSLRQMFTSARAIQDWLTDSARTISCKHGQNVEWCTPLGLTIIQPYVKLPKYDRMKESFTWYNLPHKPSDLTGKPNTLKQKNAFAPNFVHSLDSSHMMLTSLFCEQAGLTFASVHDCYWTHAGTVDQMNQICRKQFIALHEQPILSNTLKYFLERYNDASFKAVPETGCFDIKDVSRSTYFFS